MKKTLLGLLALTAVSSAAADSVGGHIGTTAGLHYQTDLTANSAVRYGLNLNALNLFRGGSVGLGGEVAYLRNAGSQNFGGLNPYYGFGLGVGASVGSYTGVSAYPHVLGGLGYNVAGPVSIFVEGNVGPTIAISNGGSGIGLGAGVRLGLNYQIR
ncbi:hypothetical protein E5F05_18620 [Deinococcus metallilatus]|uniref:Porin family protein n=2 Tax=Deinococcus TaxID=1298 RepID=A0AAJ5JXE4_9DEIO|nr:hypothetical protein [Deinococcus metallilatus]MBB5296179.1 hypothetical protein [Deinococcus metallilatus]QBY09772.1 hypothetical protein E5F05_18620 [Deinococcus metallilatus]RXJ08970.1 hypothetical protein ERJ73_17455 [Deinococcus metallilatus]TLK23651.1 hypothetical protein FCS05_15625 [Deinococcus metallilatus]GMA14045.1 hypothetical protein GCM10025871_03760 [Deinococcus metallilatus]